MQTDIHTKARAKMFIAALFITAPKWKQSRCQSIPQWDAIQQQKGRNHWCKCNMGDSPKDIMLSERSQTQRTNHTLYGSIYRKHPEEANLRVDWFPQLGRELRSAVNRNDGGSYWRDKNAPKIRQGISETIFLRFIILNYAYAYVPMHALCVCGRVHKSAVAGWKI